MAKFQDSNTADATSVVPDRGPEVADRSIGSIIAETRNLTADQVEKVLAYQKTKGIRFGEAAIALGYASTDDVLFALSQQFHYPYAAEDRRKANPELVALNQPFGVQAESFRAIRSQIMMRLFNEGQERRAIAVVSPDSGDGKTFFAANLAGADPMRTGWVSMRFSWTAYIVPFLFVFSPSLLLQSTSWTETAFSITMAIVGVWFVSAGMVGYGLRLMSGWLRAASITAGALLLLPLGMAGWVVYANVLGVVLAVAVTAVGLADRRKDLARVSAESASSRP
jgi:hypothetical protein